MIKSLMLNLHILKKTLFYIKNSLKRQNNKLQNQEIWQCQLQEI